MFIILYVNKPPPQGQNGGGISLMEDSGYAA